MKKFLYSKKNGTILFLLLTLISCVEQKPVEKSLGESTRSPAGNKGSEKQIISKTSKVVRVKNYNQYNMTLQKLTGLDRTKYSALFESIKGSLPADNEIEALTPFNLIAMSRLADAYCFDYVNTKMSSSLFTQNQKEKIVDHFIEKFLDTAPDSRPDYYLSLKNELTNVMNNDDGTGRELFPNPDGSATGIKNLSVATCVTVLVSPYITLLE
jgi:hypothetical protein